MARPVLPSPSVARPLVAALLLTAFGCAVSAPADLGPDVDPNMPSVDAPNDPKPAEAGAPMPEGEGEGERRAEPEPEEDAGSTVPPPADAGADVAPPPPPPPTAPKPTQGEVLVTEVMYDSSGAEPQGEWIEVHNTASTARSLSGLVLADGAGRTHTIGAGVVIGPGAYALLARSQSGAASAKLPASAILYEYGKALADTAGVLLANGASGGIALKDGATVIAQADYGGWFSQSGGKSVQLRTLTYAAGTDKAQWCLSETAWASGAEKGTPGSPSDCP